MLDTRVLVLNKSWVAVNVAPAKRALSLLFQGYARVVHPTNYALYDFEGWCAFSRLGLDDDNCRYIHTPSFQVRLPEVILLGLFNGFVHHEVRLSRRAIFVRDKHQCQYCGRRPPNHELSIDHVVPRSRGGEDTWENLVLACTRCNVRKGNRTPEEANMHLPHRPIRPRWLPRFGTPLEQHEFSSWKQFLDKAV